MTEANFIEHFHAFLEARDLIPPAELKADGGVYRLDSAHDNGQGDGAYCLHALMGNTVGWAINYQIDDKRHFYSNRGTHIPPDIRADLDKKLAESKAREDAEAARILDIALAHWEDGDRIEDHPYVLKKGLQTSDTLSILREWPIGKQTVANAAVIPIVDLVSRDVVSFQVIDEGGEKRFQKGCKLPRTAGLWFGDIFQADSIVYTESYTNAFAIHSSTGLPVVISFGSGRLMGVVDTVFGINPGHNIVLAADDDFGKTDGKNAGRVTATAIQTKYENVEVHYPPREEGEKKAQWHEVWRTAGAEAIAAEFVTDRERRARLVDALDVRMSAPEWLVSKVLERGTLAELLGPSGAGKSYVVVDLACSLAVGRNFLGKFAVKPSKVIYIVGEGAGGVARRVEAWQRTYKTRLSRGALKLSVCPFGMLNTAEADALVGEIDRIRAGGFEPDLIVLDTLARNFGDGDENSTQDMSRFVATVDERLKRRYNACVLIVHHTNKMGLGRGSGALYAALDTELSLTPDAEVKGVSVLTATKVKDGADGVGILPLQFTSYVFEDLLDNFGEPTVSGTIAPMEEEDLISAVLQSYVAIGSIEVRYQEIVNKLSEAYLDVKTLGLQFGGTKPDLTPLRGALRRLEGLGLAEASENGEDVRLSEAGMRYKVNVHQIADSIGYSYGFDEGE